MTDQQQREAFLAAIAADRYDTATRLVFADWLEERGDDDTATEQRRMATREWVEADKWMHEFAGQLGSADWDGRDIDYDDCIRAGHDAHRHGDYFVQQGGESAQDTMYEGNNREDFWRCWSIVTGVPVSEEQREHSVFSCSC
jgi:uncharacterized protein (TIGR02996 family)